MNNFMYFRANIMAEPLVGGWYAWAHLVPPATLARNVSERHLRIIDSYLESPESHEAAVRNPKLLGGPFMDLPGDCSEQVRELRESTCKDQARLIALSQALAELDCLLRQEGRGYSLEELYARVPQPLQGYVELVYDLNSYPSFRLIEPLLYRSEYFDPSLQSVLLTAIRGDDRPFVLSTPRLTPGDGLVAPVPFSAPVWDELFRAKHAPDDAMGIGEQLGVPANDRELFYSFFTEDQPKPYQKYDGGGARWRYFGHACILLETNNVSVLLDPVLSYTYESDISRYTYDDLPDVIDYALITHNHQDHILFETLLQLRHRIRHVVVPRNGGGGLQDPSLRLILRQCGFTNVTEISEMEEIAFPHGSITAIPFLGEHGDLNVVSKSAYLLRLGGHSLLFAADSCNLSPCLYHHLHREIGDVDTLFVGMECDGAPVSWIYGPLFTQKLERSKDHSRRLAGSNYQRALNIVEQLRCKEVYVYAMGQEPWLNYVMSIKYTEQSNPIVQSNLLLETCRARGIAAERLFGEKEILLS